LAKKPAAARGRRQIEDTRRWSSDTLLRLVTESFTDFAIMTMDPAGKVEYWNPGAEVIFGYSEAEMLGRSADVIFTAEDRKQRAPEKEREVALVKGRASDERWHARKDGSLFYASGVMVPLFENTALLGFSKIARDLTQQVQAETALRERGMLKRLVDAQEDERQRIARDLHDQLGQHLTALRLRLEGLKANYGAEPAMIRAIDQTQRLAQKIDNDVTFLAWELRPTALDNLGLRNALAHYLIEWSKNYGIPSEFHTARLRKNRLDPEIEINLYRIAQEALNNVLKHAKAGKVSCLLEFRKDDVVLVIEDDGVGFDPGRKRSKSKRGKGLGMIGMRERAALLGGTLEIESAPGAGTTVIVRVPIRPTLTDKSKVA
jgi:PAS domain S-box-containing protein